VKDQYFGDVNDYVKYGLLRALSAGAALRVGVVWMRTPDDDRTDGSRTSYLRDADWRAHDPELYDRLARLAAPNTPRSVELFRRWDLVPAALDYDATLSDLEHGRAEWMAAARETLRECPLLFFDPDNGLEVESVALGKRGSNKYLYWHEARAAWDAGHSLLVYQHFPRVTREAYVNQLVGEASRRLPGSRVTPLHTPHVLFLLAAQHDHAAALARAAQVAAERWAGRITAGRPAQPDDRAKVIVEACEALAEGRADRAAVHVARRYPFASPARSRSTASHVEAVGVWLDDGFVDRYDGARLVYPGVLRLLSAEWPTVFPFRAAEKGGASHPAYAQLHPALDLVTPVARGGADVRANRVTTSRLHRAAKANWTLEELGWRLRASGTLSDWDGLTGWFRDVLATKPELGRHAPVAAWARLLARAWRVRREGTNAP